MDPPSNSLTAVKHAVGAVPDRPGRDGRRLPRGLPEVPEGPGRGVLGRDRLLSRDASAEFSAAYLGAASPNDPEAHPGGRAAPARGVRLPRRPPPRSAGAGRPAGTPGGAATAPAASRL